MSQPSIPFTRDLGRKLLALAIALFVWWRVYLGIQQTETIEFTIVTDRTPHDTATHVIEIIEPANWQLVEPLPGTKIEIDFKGVTSDLEAYLRDGVRAVISPSSIGATAGTLSSPVRYEDFEWPDASRARGFLEGPSGRKVLNLGLEKLQTLPIQLSTDLLTLDNRLPDGFFLALDEAYFSPSTIELEGPTQIIEGLQQSLEERAKLFRPVLAAGETNMVHGKIELTQDAEEQGLRLKQRSIELHIPVYVEQVSPFTLNPTPEQIQLYGTAPEDAPGNWSVDEYRGSGFTVRYRHDPRIDPIPDERSLRESILFFVNLADLPSGAVNGQVMPLEWVIRDPSGLDDPVRFQALKHAISLTPVNPDDPDIRSVTLNLPPQ